MKWKRNEQTDARSGGNSIIRRFRPYKRNGKMKWRQGEREKGRERDALGNHFFIVYLPSYTVAPRMSGAFFCLFLFDHSLSRSFSGNDWIFLFLRVLDLGKWEGYDTICRLLSVVFLCFFLMHIVFPVRLTAKADQNIWRSTINVFMILLTCHGHHTAYREKECLSEWNYLFLSLRVPSFGMNLSKLDKLSSVMRFAFHRQTNRTTTIVY